MTVLVTGSAGFIGMHVVARLLDAGERVVGFDNRSDPGAAGLGHARADCNAGRTGYTDIHGDLVYPRALEKAVRAHRPDAVVHLAARTGLSHALADPHACQANNATAFLHVLEACRSAGVGHLVFASSAAVYGAGARLPQQESGCTDHPLSLPGALKKANEAAAHACAAHHGVAATGLRLFDVYGPWNRPDSDCFQRARELLSGEPVAAFERGARARDLVYIDDVVDAIVAVLERPATADPAWDAAQPDPASSRAPWRLFNVGSGLSLDHEDLVAALAHAAGREPASRKPAEPPTAEPAITQAATRALERATGWRPRTDLDTGLRRFLDWFRDFHGDEL